jgi:hypothetical protein
MVAGEGAVPAHARDILKLSGINSTWGIDRNLPFMAEVMLIVQETLRRQNPRQQLECDVTVSGFLPVATQEDSKRRMRNEETENRIAKRTPKELRSVVRE